MRRFLVLGLGCAIALAGSLAAVPAWAHHSDVVLRVTDWGENNSTEVFDAEEYLEAWSGDFSGPINGSWTFSNRVGFRITEHTPSATEVPDMTGYGFTYSDATLTIPEWGSYSGQIALVEDPTDPNNGYYGRFWGSDFQGTIKFRETGSSMVGEAHMTVFANEQTYDIPVSLQGDRDSQATVTYDDKQLLYLSGYDMLLSGTTTGEVNGSATLATTAIRLKPGPDGGSGSWTYVQDDDGAMIGTAHLPDDLGAGQLWLFAEEDLNSDPRIDTYQGMILTEDADMPEAAATGTFNLDPQVLQFDGALSHMTVQPGDLNGDGFVGGDDLDIVRSYWGSDVPVHGTTFGDPSGDGFVGGDDLDIVRANWGQGIPPTAVPEPSTLAGLLGLGLGLGLACRRRAA